MGALLKDSPSKSIVGWTKKGTVVWLYWTETNDLAFVRMSPALARKCARNYTGLDSKVRESLQDCSYSAAKYGPVEDDLFERSVVNPRENPQVSTIGISAFWGEA